MNCSFLFAKKIYCDIITICKRRLPFCTSGSGLVWLKRYVRDVEIVSSNLIFPTIYVARNGYKCKKVMKMTFFVFIRAVLRIIRPQWEFWKTSFNRRTVWAISKVWNDGSFYDIVGAHEKNLLTNEDLNAIAELYCGKSGTDRLSRVKRSYLHDIIWKNRPEATIQDVIIKENLGTYSECFVGILYDKGNCLFAEYAVVYEVDGLNFNYSNGFPMLLWTEGNFSSLHEAYESDLLTRSDLEKIHFLYWNKDQQTKTES